VNYEGRIYSFLDIPRVHWVPPTSGLGKWVTDGYNKGFKLFDLTKQTGKWRLVLVENDMKYKYYAMNHVHVEHNPHGNWATNVHTFDMSTGQWSEVNTGFTVKSKKNGNSDDIMLESGARRINLTNVEQHSMYIAGIGQAVKARKDYNGRGHYFKYVFGLQVK
jgi:hypothetical protein